MKGSEENVNNDERLSRIVSIISILANTAKLIEIIWKAREKAHKPKHLRRR